jgi:hypothetical protein
MDEYDQGTHHSIGYRVGDRKIAILVMAFERYMPKGAVLDLMTPIGAELTSFLDRAGTKVKVNWWTKHYQIGLNTHGSELVALLDKAGATRLAVWISVLSESGELLAELEDGNDYLWLRDNLAENVRIEMLNEVRQTSPLN